MAKPLGKAICKGKVRKGKWFVGETETMSAFLRYTRKRKSEIAKNKLMSKQPEWVIAEVTRSGPRPECRQKRLAARQVGVIELLINTVIVHNLLHVILGFVEPNFGRKYAWVLLFRTSDPAGHIILPAVVRRR